MDISTWRVTYPELSQLFDDQKIEVALKQSSLMTPRTVWVGKPGEWNPDGEAKWVHAIGLYAAHLLVIENQQLAAIVNIGANLAADRVVSPPSAITDDHLLTTTYGVQYRELKQGLPMTGIGFYD